MNDSQQKKSAIIAGMAPGFGAAIAKTLIADGYNVYGLSVVGTFGADGCAEKRRSGLVWG